MSGDDPDFLEFFAGEFWPLRRVGFLLNRHRSLLRRAVVEARHRLASRPEERSQPDFGGDDLVVWPPRGSGGHGQVLDPPRPGPPRDRLGPTYADERLTSTARTEADP